MSNRKKLDILEPPSGLTIYHQGPNLDEGPLPSLFYFALSGDESLTVDPYNQPVMYLKDVAIRVFSFTIPSHGPGLDNKTAMTRWAEEIRNEHNFIEEFVTTSRQNLDYLIEKEYVDPEKIAVAGLSRGGFMATHLAAQDPRIKAILAFAPLTRLDTIQEFQGILDLPLVKSLSLEAAAENLVDRHLRFYIGNRDTRVKTDKCFQFVQNLSDTAYEKGYRSPTVELIIYSSIGFKGHGTPPQIFRDGVEWVKGKLATDKIEK